MAGALGLAGGLIIGPILLAMNIDPAVSTATTNFMNTLTSMCTTIQFALLSKVEWDYAGIFMVISVIASVVGTNVLKIVVEKYNKKSIMVFVVATVLIASTIATSFTSGIKLIEDIKNGIDVLEFRTICK